MYKDFTKYRNMFISLAKVLDVKLHSNVSYDFMDFMSKGIDFTVVSPNEDAMSFYKNLSQNPEKLQELGLKDSYDFLRLQTKKLWYRNNNNYEAPTVFDDDYDLWFVQHLNSLFEDNVLKGDFNKTIFLKNMFSELKYHIGLSMTNAA